MDKPKIVKYVAEFPLKYGDTAVRVYKSLAVAKREVAKAKGRLLAPIRFYATIHVYEHSLDGKGVKKTLVMEIDG